MPEFEVIAYQCSAWRCVEHQSTIATVPLVRSLADHDILEQLLEDTKPVVPPEAAGLHWLAATPFRYQRAFASRFGPAGSRGVWYGAEHYRTALREALFHRLRFFDDYDAEQPRSWQGTLIYANLNTDRALDLHAAAYDADRAALESPSDYSACHQLAGQAMEQGIELIRYRSVRSPSTIDQRACVAVLSPQAFGAPAIIEHRQRTFTAERDESLARIRLSNGEREEVALANLIY